MMMKMMMMMWRVFRVPTKNDKAPWTNTPPSHNPPSWLPNVRQSEPRSVGRIGSGVRVSLSFQKIPPGFVLLRQRW